MTGPADDAELVVKMLNSGAPGVMLDLEDSMANSWPHLMRGVANIAAALHGDLTYDDAKRGRRVGIEPGPAVIWSRTRGLHLAQAGVMPGTDLGRHPSQEGWPHGRGAGSLRLRAFSRFHAATAGSPGAARRGARAVDRRRRLAGLAPRPRFLLLAG